MLIVKPHQTKAQSKWNAFEIVTAKFAITKELSTRIHKRQKKSISRELMLSFVFLQPDQQAQLFTKLLEINQTEMHTHCKAMPENTMNSSVIYIKWCENER